MIVESFCIGERLSYEFFGRVIACSPSQASRVHKNFERGASGAYEIWAYLFEI